MRKFPHLDTQFHGWTPAHSTWEAETKAIRAENKRLHEALVRSSAGLAAAICLLEKGGRSAAASDKMFWQMLQDYRGHLAAARAALNTEGEADG